MNWIVYLLGVLTVPAIVVILYLLDYYWDKFCRWKVQVNFAKLDKVYEFYWQMRDKQREGFPVHGDKADHYNTCVSELTCFIEKFKKDAKI